MIGETEAHPVERERNALLEGSAIRHHDSPLFAALLRAVADAEDLQLLARHAPQFGLRLLRSAIHYLLLANPGHALAAYFPSIAGAPLPADEAVPAFKAFCREHRAELEAILRARSLQTTSVGRAVELLLALDEVAGSIGGPFSLVEIGCSAGLLLLFDRYRYDFPDGSALGAADAEVVVPPSRFTGRAPRAPAAFPRIVRRIGIDLRPVDVTDPAARRWILGCTQADWIDDFNLLERALRFRSQMPLEIVAGDAMTALPDVLDAIEGPVCIVHSRCLYQWPPEQRQAFSALLLRLSGGRTLHKIGIERNGPGRDPADLGGGAVHDIVHTIYRRGSSRTRILGRTSDQLEWLLPDGDIGEGLRDG